MIKEDEIGLRIRELRESQKLSRPAMAMKLGIGKHQRLADVENGRQRPPADLLSRIVEIFHARPEWLFEGKPPMLKTEGEQKFEGNLGAIGSATSAVGRLDLPLPYKAAAQQIMFALETGAADLVRSALDGFAASESGCVADLVMVPRYDVQASAGAGALIHSELIVDYLAFRQEWVSRMGLNRQKLALIEVHGDSMEPALHNSDLILIDLRASELSVNGIYALQHRGHLLVKRIQVKLDGTVIIKSDNPAYEPEMLSPDEAGSLAVVGRVVWFGRAM